MKIKFKKWNLTLITILFLIALYYYENNILQVSHYTVISNKIPNAFNNFKIVQISDLHSKSFGRNNDKLIKNIKRESPNIIVMTGDMINTKDTDYNVFLSLSEQLSKDYDVYYIVGNHEQNLSDNKKENYLIGLMNLELKYLTIKNLL
ncbi:metallophosphoesterase [Caloramator sp. mosi_1]|uniref:metallophosphoesterase n=1 Tax=Caloramator sp. mosi_1 TaxID=3023090 RepID=UPI00236314C2|nr:metallophosphoesterase [Caloramator sp. mosi_1]WDC83436.1 metallophosphoesterase [Caloramator sp. mosi_1]